MRFGTATLFKQTSAGVLNAFFPPVCLHCHERIAEQSMWLCGNCRDRLSYVPMPYCPKCGYPLTDTECSNCAENEYAFTQARSVFMYENAARALVHELKYTGYTRIADWLGNQMFRAVLDSEAYCTVDCVASIPLHRVRKRERGFNQSALLGQALAARLEKPFVDDALLRRHYTESQTLLHADLRRRNVRGAFRIGRYDPTGQKMLLVDDVFTTGSTVNEAAKTLLRAGAAEVYVLTACHGL